MGYFLTGDQHYANALSDVAASFRVLKPPRRLSVSAGAAQSLILKRPGDSGKPWSAASTSYMIEPMDMLASRNVEAVAFVGPAQSGKTAGLGEGWMSHVVVNDPGDMLMVQMTEAKAREYSKQRIDRALKSPDLAALLSNNKREDNTHDKGFKHGMWLRIAWPTVTNLSSTSYRYVFLTDYDRMPDDLDGEGDPFGMALARIRTFLSRGKVCVESSPGRPWVDADWKPATPHEAPPVGGVLGIYNRSDRRRWYWPCLDCREWFEAAPGVGLFNLPSDDDLMDDLRTGNVGKMATHYSKVHCPHCKAQIAFDQRHLLNARGRWLADNTIIDCDGVISGDAMTSSIAGFWLGGVAAAYQTWENLLNKHFQGLRDYAMTGNEQTLQTAINTDQGMPYMSRHLIEGKGLRKSASERTEKGLARYVVPDETRCVMASVDVQGGSTARFVVQVHAVGPYSQKWLIDRYEIRESKREGMGDKFAPIDPAGYAEDWDILTERVVMATYQTSDPNREIRVKLVTVDTGGEGNQNGGEGVSHNAYAWFRVLRRIGVSARVALYKGASARTAPLIKEVRVGKRNGKDQGDIPLYLCNPNLLSDIVSANLKRDQPGPGYMHFPSVKHPVKNPDGWLPQSFFDELTAESRNVDGTWQKIRKRNESFDLCRMIEAGCARLGLEKVNWDKPPDWLKPLPENEDCVTPEERRDIKANISARIAAARGEVEAMPMDPAAAPPRQVRQRRVATFGLN